MASITKLAPQILAGSAVVGFGFAFGRDIYRETKRHWVFVLIFVVLASCLYGLFISSVWMARNYRTSFESFAKRLGAFSIFAVCYFLLFSVTFLLVEMAPGTNDEKEKTIVQSTSLWEVHADSLVDGSPLSAGFLVQTLVGIGGLILGFTQRHKRRLVWQAEDSNATFVAEHGLQLLDDENLRDSEGDRFELENNFRHVNEIEFVAIDHSGKRGYLSYDEIGRYTKWSGLVSIR